MLNRFTVLALYSIYFSKTRREYATMFRNLVNFHNVDISHEELSNAALKALNMMKPTWKTKNIVETKSKPTMRKKLNCLNLNCLRPSAIMKKLSKMIGELVKKSDEIR